MSHFYATVLNHLEYYQPERFARLKADRLLAQEVDGLVAQLYAETARELASIKRYHPDVSEEELIASSQDAAIAAVLPTPSLEASVR